MEETGVLSEPKVRTQAPARDILVVDTDPGVRWSLEKGLALSGYTVHTAGTAEQGVSLARRVPVAAVLMELMPEAGLTVEVLSAFLSGAGSPSVVCASIDAPPHLVIECIRRGASDFLLKPFSLAEVRSALARALSSGDPDAQEGGEAAEEADHEFSLLVGVSLPMQETRAIIKQVAKTDLNCLIRGESGVGKDIVAREIHRLSRRADKPFIKVNCSALPEQLLESELFGFEKGAFTGAIASKPGRFSLADKGIIFLDEICEIHPNLQAKLLQVMEHKEFTKLGGRASTKVDVQIIAATNADIEQRTKEGAFRQDLYFRLNEVCIWVPPLSHRREDVPLLVRHFVKKYRHFAGGASVEPSGEDIAALSQREWIGNIRELESTIKRWLVLGKRDGALIAQAPLEASPKTVFAPKPEQKTPQNESSDLPPEKILETLEKYQWNRRKTAEILGISYQALRRRIEKYKLDQRR